MLESPKLQEEPGRKKLPLLQHNWLERSNQMSYEETCTPLAVGQLSEKAYMKMSHTYHGTSLPSTYTSVLFPLNFELHSFSRKMTQNPHAHCYNVTRKKIKQLEICSTLYKYAQKSLQRFSLITLANKKVYNITRTVVLYKFFCMRCQPRQPNNLSVRII